MSQKAYSVKSARAVYNDGALIIFGLIEVTATNYEPYLERSPILIFPPSHQFFTFEEQTSEIGGQIIIAKPVLQTFPTPGGKPDSITISAETNKLDVKVDEMDPLAPSTQVLRSAFKAGQEGGAAIMGGGGELPSAHKDATVFNDVATGYSKFSFEDAFEDAIGKLPARPTPVDWLTSVRMTGMGGEFGGIAGVRRLWVGVSRVTITG
jgi:hypothetical protein